MFEQLPFNPDKFRGHVSLWPRRSSIWKIFNGTCPDCPWENACQISSPYLLTALEDLEFTPKNLGGHVTLATPPLEQF